MCIRDSVRTCVRHARSAQSMWKDISIFSSQLNKKVCNEHINVVDDGTIPFNRGSWHISKILRLVRYNISLPILGPLFRPYEISLHKIMQDS